MECYILHKDQKKQKSIFSSWIWLQVGSIAYASNTNSIQWITEEEKEQEKAEDICDKDILYICMKLPKNKNVFKITKRNFSKTHYALLYT